MNKIFITFFTILLYLKKIKNEWAFMENKK